MEDSHSNKDIFWSIFESLMSPRSNSFFFYVTSSPAASVALQRHALVVICDPQNAALLWTRRLRGAPGQDDPDLPPVQVQVPALPHVHVLMSDWLKACRPAALTPET